MKRLLQRTNTQRVAEKPGLLIALFLCASIVLLVISMRGFSATPQNAPQVSMGQSNEEADRKSAGCITCHSPMDEPTMHPTKTVQLGCTDCHGGNPSTGIKPGAAPNSPEYLTAKEKAHVHPRDPAFRNRGALPERV